MRTQDHPTTGRGSRRLVRSRVDRKVAGVAGGLAAYLDVDPALVRIGFVAATFMGFGIPLYLAGWILLPEGDATRSSDHRGARATGPATWIGIAFLVMAAMAVSDGIGVFDRGVLFPLVLIGVGLALWRSGDAGPSGPGDPTSRTTSAAPAPTGADASTGGQPTPLDEPSWPSRTPSAVGERVAPDPPEPYPTAADATPAQPTWTPPQPRPRSLLGRLTLAVAAIAVGVTVVIARVLDLTVSPVTLLAVVLLVLGLGLVIGAWFGRARWLIVPAALVVPLLGVASVVDAIDVPFRFEAGERLVPADAVVGEPIRHGFGPLTIDLAGYSPTDAPAVLEASLVAGPLQVRVPDDLAVSVDASVAAGEVRLFGAETHGVDVEDQVTVPAGTDTALHLDLTVGTGQIEVCHEEDC